MAAAGAAVVWIEMLSEPLLGLPGLVRAINYWNAEKWRGSSSSSRNGSFVFCQVGENFVTDAATAAVAGVILKLVFMHVLGRERTLINGGRSLKKWEKWY